LLFVGLMRKVNLMNDFKQSVFDKVATHLLTQNCKSVEDGACLYRAPNGMKCAIGALIPDELYDPVFEGQAVFAFFNKSKTEYKALKEILFPSGETCFSTQQECEDFYTILQRIHDEDPIDLWKDALCNFAKKWDLKTEVLLQFAQPVGLSD